MAGDGKALAGLAIMALALAIAGCGDDAASTSSSATQDAATTATERTAEPDAATGNKGETGQRGGEGEKARGGAGQEDGSDSGGSGAKSGSSGSQSGEQSNPAPGGDTSIQEFGKEASVAERDAASRTLEAYFEARASSDNQAACANLTKVARDQLAELAAASPKIKTGSCVGAFDSIDQVAPSSARVNPMTGPVSSLRIEGERGFAIFPGKGSAIYTIQMESDRGSWKVAAIVPYQLN